MFGQARRAHSAPDHSSRQTGESEMTDSSDLRAQNDSGSGSDDGDKENHIINTQSKGTHSVRTHKSGQYFIRKAKEKREITNMWAERHAVVILLAIIMY